MSNARDFASRVPVDGALSNRNMVINGGMTISQRGTSFTNVSASRYTLDRWNLEASGAGTFTITQEADGPAGFSKSTKILCTTADSSNTAGELLYFRQMFEGQDCQRLGFGTSDAQSFTVSFWVKSNRAATYVLTAQQGVSGSMSGRTYTINAADTWEYKSFTFEGDTVNSIADNTSIGLQIHWWLQAGSNFNSGSLSQGWTAASAANYAPGLTANIGDTINDYWQITGVQLEVGDTATPFEHEPYSVTLQKCQRYYQVGSFNGNAGTDLGDTNPTVSWMPVTAMRASASMSMRDDNGVPNKYIDTQGNSVGWAYGGLSHRADNTSFTGSYTDSIDTGMFILDIGSASVGASSWMRFFWQADAEL
jgi:hypothetical protein